MIPLIFLTNGRYDCLAETVKSVAENLTGFGFVTVVDDSGRIDYALEGAIAPLSELRGEALIIRRAAPHGYGLAMKTVWDVAQASESDFVCLWEDDFVLCDPVDLRLLAGVLYERPHLAQMALLRQPWFGNEHRHGGLIEALEAQGQRFEQVKGGGVAFIEHRACFTGNPTVIPRRTFKRPWPDGSWSESRFGRDLFASDPKIRCAYWGLRSDAPRVEHIGTVRVGSGY